METIPSLSLHHYSGSLPSYNNLHQFSLCETGGGIRTFLPSHSNPLKLPVAVARRGKIINRASTANVANRKCTSIIEIYEKHGNSFFPPHKRGLSAETLF